MYMELYLFTLAHSVLVVLGEVHTLGHLHPVVGHSEVCILTRERLGLQEIFTNIGGKCEYIRLWDRYEPRRKVISVDGMLRLGTLN